MYDFISSYWPILILLMLILVLVLLILLHRKNTFFYWAARITAILDILFLAWESLELGGYKPDNFFSDNIITSIPLLIILIIAWKYDLFGAIGFCFAGVFFLTYFEWGDFPIGIIPIIIGILFTISWFKRRKQTKVNIK